MNITEISIILSSVCFLLLEILKSIHVLENMFLASFPCLHVKGNSWDFDYKNRP